MTIHNNMFDSDKEKAKSAFGSESIEWEEGVISDYDCVIVATAHERIDFSDLAKWSDCIVDTRNAMQSINTSEGQVTKA